MSFSRSISLTRAGSSSLSGGPNSVLRRGRLPVEEKKVLCKAPSVASSWQPWTPVPQASEKLLPTEETPEDSLFAPRLGESNATGVLPSSRIRHRSEPQHPKEKPFMFNLDDENIRTSDVWWAIDAQGGRGEDSREGGHDSVSLPVGDSQRSLCHSYSCGCFVRGAHSADLKKIYINAAYLIWENH